MKVVVFTGAGVSRESGLKTYRDSDGLWNGFSVYDVCSRDAYQEHPDRVIGFYNDLRREMIAAQPNAAHIAIADLEDHYTDVTVVTQNVDDLHERGGSSKVLHLHGNIMEKKSDAPYEGEILPCREDIQMGDVAENGRQFRPNIVFFQEGLPNDVFDAAWDATQNADVLIVVGSTLSVGPANQIALKTKAKRIIVVDPNPPTLPKSLTYSTSRNITYIREGASTGVAKAIELLKFENPNVVNPETFTDSAVVEAENPV